MLYLLAFIISIELMELPCLVTKTLPTIAQPNQTQHRNHNLPEDKFISQEKQEEDGPQKDIVASNNTTAVLQARSEHSGQQLLAPQSLKSQSADAQKDDQQNEQKSQLLQVLCGQQIKFNSNQSPDNQPQASTSPKNKLIRVFQNEPTDKVFSGKPRKYVKSYNYDDQQYESNQEPFRFPFVNHYLKQFSAQYLNTFETSQKVRQQLGKSFRSDTFVNCDVRYFNWKLFVQDVGKFQVVLIDPPWRIKGAQQNDSQFMFSNCKFSLQYNTMANSQIARIPLHMMSDQGFIFLWILNSQLDSSLQIMEKWGYELVEQVIWVKLKDEKINLTHGYYFMHSYQVCLIGYKRKKEVTAEKHIMVRKGVSWNTVFAQVRQKSQKPQDIYGIIDIMFKGSKKVQIFARNNNLRFGFFSIGNQLGESYDKWLLKLSCDKCADQLSVGKKRYKSKTKANYDLCSRCVTSHQPSTFFQLKNEIDENIRHQYVSCNHCGAQPIWGLRFSCATCQDFDICENCFDKNLQPDKNFHPIDHQFIFLQVPVFGNGFHIHETKCSSCYQNPIIGIYFSCSICKNYNMCQKCYFQRPNPVTVSNGRRHKSDHPMQVIFQSQIQHKKKYQCFGCKTEILQDCYMCQNCFNFFFCQKCYDNRGDFKSLYANTHKKYHVLTKIY